LISHYGDIKRNTFLSQLINIWQKGSIIENIQKLQKLSLRVKNIPEDNLLYLFMVTLKDNIQHKVCLFEPKSLEKDFIMERKVENKNMATRRVATSNYRENDVPSPNLTQPTRFTPQQMDARRTKGLCFNCDNKYSKGHKYGEKKLFYIDYEEEKDQELEPSQDIDLEETTSTIYCHALVDISNQTTLEIQGYIKKKKVTMLIDFGSTYNFNYKLAKDLTCFVFLAP
jgi:hypothetical protein